MKPRELVHRGRVVAAGLWFDRGFLSDARARERIAALWSPGDTVWVVGEGWLLRFAHEQVIDAEGPGLPLVDRGGVLVTAPLSELEWKDRPRGSVVTVRGGLATGEDLSERVDPSAWLDLEPPIAVVRSCAPPPVEARASMSRPTVGRAAFGVDEVSEEARSLLDLLDLPPGEPPPKPVPEPPPPEPKQSWWSSWFGSAPEPVPPRGMGGTGGTGGSGGSSGPPPPGMWEGLGAFLENLFGGAPPSTEQVLERQTQSLQDLLERFDGDLEEALRHAIPLGGAGGMSNDHPALRMPPPRDRLRPSLGAPSSGGGSSFSAANDMYELLRSTYRTAAEQLIDAGEIEKAAFVYADLLRDVSAALQLLEQHEEFQLAAELAESRKESPARVARLYALAGDLRRAFRIARDEKVFGQVLASLEGEQDLLLRAAYAGELVAEGRYRAAVELVWDTPLRPGALPWLQVLVERGGPDLPTWLVRWSVLDPEAAREPICAVIDEGTPDERHALAVELHRSNTLGEWTRPLVRALLADSGKMGFEREILRTLLMRSEVADIQADQPPLHNAIPRPPQPMVFKASTAGGLPILDAAWVHSGTLVALGQGGLALLDSVGTTVWRDRTPCTSLVADDEGFIVIGIQGESPSRLMRIDLRTRRVHPWVTVELGAWSRRYRHSQWLVEHEGRPMAVDLTAVRDDPKAWRWAWRGPEVPGTVVALDQDQDGAWMLIQAELPEHWRYDDLWFLRSRTARPEGEELCLRGRTVAVRNGLDLEILGSGTQNLSLRAEPVRLVVPNNLSVCYATREQRGICVCPNARENSTLLMEGANSVGLGFRDPNRLVVWDDLGRLLWFDTFNRRVTGPFRVV